MKSILALALTVLAVSAANARPRPTPQRPAPAAQSWSCMAVGYGGGSAGTSHVEWAHGPTLEATRLAAYKSCTRSTGGECSVQNCYRER